MLFIKIEENIMCSAGTAGTQVTWVLMPCKDGGRGAIGRMESMQICKIVFKTGMNWQT